MTAAQAIFYPLSPAEAKRQQAEEAVSQYGFYTALPLSSTGTDAKTGSRPQKAVFRIAARHVYRLYINGEIVMHGPARTAHGYARVDEVDVTDRLRDGVNHLAIEVMTYGDLYCGYSNDCTLSDGPGFVMAELEGDGSILTATGTDGSWKVCRLPARVGRTGRISHCREASEIYYLNEEYTLWRQGVGTFTDPAPAVAPVLLPRTSPLPTLAPHKFDRVVGYGTCTIREDIQPELLFFEDNPAYTPAGYYASLKEHPLMDCRRTADSDGGITATRSQAGLTLSGASDTWVLFDSHGGENVVGFPAISCLCEFPGIIDIVHTELLDTDGRIAYHYNNVTRLHVQAGKTVFAAMEPGLGRYIQVYFRGCGQVTVLGVSMLAYSYPDMQRTSFLCSDDNINRLYGAAYRTLLNNTLDIFMDCPDRERGGWLCDSLWTARAAALMLSDTRVEKEFLEDFLLTPADGMFHGFFPEVYPGNKPSYKDMTGITTWTFWLMCQVCEYISRTGDMDFRNRFSDRIAAFVRGSQDFIGESGLLENLPWLFIDWSMSNFGEYQTPISTPANALYAYMLIQLGKTFDRSAWVAEGERIRGLLRDAIAGDGGRNLSTLTSFPDSFTVSGDGRLHGRGRISETGMATALWAELFAPGETPALDKAVRDTMGPAPRFAADPNIGQSQLFIGLCIRLDMLARRGHTDKLWEDLLAIYMPQLKEGPGTLWESTGIGTSSRCHGFTSHAGVHLVRDVLGMGIPDRLNKTVDIAPHLCGLRWARGTMEMPEGLLSVSWRYDGDSFSLTASLPAGYTGRLTLPREVRVLEPDRISVTIANRE